VSPATRERLLTAGGIVSALLFVSLVAGICSTGIL